LNNFQSQLFSEDSAQAAVVITIPSELIRSAEARREVPELALLSEQVTNHDLVASLMCGLARYLNHHKDSIRGVRILRADSIGVVAATPPGTHDAVADLGNTPNRALLTRARSFIEEHLSDPQLTPALVAKEIGVSLRQLQNLFAAEESTVADWIRSRRLERCRHDLADLTLGHVPVSKIGSRWGFSNPSHFSKLFRAKYGISPRDYRRYIPRRRMAMVRRMTSGRC
jgi:AraC-like DNA-binding protein